MAPIPGPSNVADYIASNPSFDNPLSHTSPLPSLYADLSRQRKSNPSGYRASLDWWSSTLTDTTFLGLLSSPSSSTPDSLPDRTVLRLDENVKAKWTVDGVGRPLGLGTVISELEKDSSVVRLETFLRSSKAIEGPANLRTGKGLRGYLPTPTGVASALLLIPAKWAASQLISLATGGNDDDDGEYSEDEQLFKAKRGDWVIYALVHKIGSAFLARHFDEASLSPLASLLSPAEFRDRLADVCRAEFGFVPSERDAKLVLKHLTRDRPGAIVICQPDIIKLSPTEHEPASPITDEDRGIVAVKTTLARVESQITSLESQIGSRTAQIKTALRANNKPHAASYLRSRKALQEVLDKRMQTRENLTAVVLKIEQAKTDVEVMRAYKASSDVLGSVLKSNELRMENVDSVVGELEERLASQREVDEAIRGVETGVQAVDEDEVQDELEQLLREKTADEDKASKEKEQDEEVKKLKERFDKLRLDSSGLPDVSTAPPTETQDAALKQQDGQTSDKPQQQPLAE